MLKEDVILQTRFEKTSSRSVMLREMARKSVISLYWVTTTTGYFFIRHTTLSDSRLKREEKSLKTILKNPLNLFVSIYY